MNYEDKTFYTKIEDKEVFEIDMMVYIHRLLRKKRFLLKSVLIGCIVGVIVSFSLPKKYTASAILAPETNQSGNNQVAGMAAMLGIGGMSGQISRDAISINRAEDIVSTTPFILELMNVKIKTLDEKIDTTIVAYLGMQSTPWWVTLFSIPNKIIDGVKSIINDNKTELKEDKINPFHLNAVQAAEVAALGGAIKAETDKKTGMIVVSSTFQDPLVAALVTDSVMSLLQEYLVRYRTNKAQQDCDYLEIVYEESKQKYYQTQTSYANYSDANQHIIRKTASSESERLLNEMNLAFQVYSQVATQLQMARAKVQEVKPVFVVLEPASVPLLPSSPNKKLIIIAFAFLSLLLSSIWILFIDDKWRFWWQEIKSV